MTYDSATFPKHHRETWFLRWDVKQCLVNCKAVKTLSGDWKWSKPVSQMVETNPAPSGTQQCVGALSIKNILGAWQTHFYICSMSDWESTCLLFRLDTTGFAGCSWILNILAVIAKTENHSLDSVVLDTCIYGSLWSRSEVFKECSGFNPN